MQRSMLFNERQTIDTDDFPTAKCGPDFLRSQPVILGIPVRRHQDSTIDDQKIGICGR
jgi:hypothetical protein